MKSASGNWWLEGMEGVYSVKTSDRVTSCLCNVEEVIVLIKIVLFESTILFKQKCIRFREK